MKFRSSVKFLETVNKWVRDGSNIISIVTANWGECVILEGKDGAMEELYLYYDDDDYNNSDLIEG